MNKQTLIEAPLPASPRRGWIDHAKGLCIILVVMMHTALGVEKEIGQTGFLHAIVAWTKPFRMPDFFLLSGYLAAGIGVLSWRSFVDRKVLRYTYFYVLWLAILTTLKAGTTFLAAPANVISAFAFGLIEPFSTLWFIYVLPFFMLAAKLAKGKLAYLIGVSAILLHLWSAAYPFGGAYAMTSQATTSTAINSISLFFVFFLAGYLGRHWIDALLETASRKLSLSVATLAIWVGLHSYTWHLGITGVPGLTILFGLLGGLAVALLALLLDRVNGFGWLAYCGRHSLPIYLAFVIPMAASREILASTDFAKYPDLMMILVLFVAILVPLVIERAVRGRQLGFLFARPAWARAFITREGI
ncbi:MAG: acyltransferase family protein [Rhizobium sp.]|nr:acyltransferase family protein [Rhizobium sp.]